MNIKAWLDIGADKRESITSLLRLVGESAGWTSQAAKYQRECAEAAASALRDVVALQDLQATEERLRRELAIDAADRCYQRALSRVAQIECAPHAKDVLLIKAGEAAAAGDDLMRAAGLKPADHPRAAQMAKACRGTPVWAHGE